VIYVLVCDHGSLAGLCVHDYKSLCAAVTICATLVNIQIGTHRVDQLISYHIIYHK